MADTFGIFMEDSVPAVRGVLKDVPSLIKGKGNPHHIKKKALGDVSNTVSQKILNVQPHERGGKASGDTCKAAKEEVSTSCKLISDGKLNLQEIPYGCTMCSPIPDLDYDIVFKSQRLTEEEIGQCFSFYCHPPLSPISSPASHFDLPDATPSMMVTPLPSDELEELSLSDVSLDDEDFGDVSF